MSQIISDHVFCMGERGQRREQVAKIYENADAVRCHETRTVTKNKDSPGKLQTQNSGGDIAKRRCYRLTAVSLVLLCVILLVGVIVLGATFSTQTTSINQLQTENNNLTLSREQLQISYDNLTVKAKQLQTSYDNLTVEQRQLTSSYNNLTEEKKQLQKERDELQSVLSALKSGWSYFSSSIYYMSMGAKNWQDSQQDCKARGADLVIINSNEEKDFIASLKGGASVWIGLDDRDSEGTWKWVDGSALTYTFWDQREPDGGTAENCALFRENWKDYPCDMAYDWICEMRI